LLNNPYHRDVTSDFLLDFQASSSPFNPKSWGFLIYPYDDDEAKDPFYNLMSWILHQAIIPSAHYYFQGYFATQPHMNKVYCQQFLDFVEANLRERATEEALHNRVIGIKTNGFKVEVLLYPEGKFPQ
jgi:hypothetical protein